MLLLRHWQNHWESLLQTLIRCREIVVTRTLDLLDSIREYWLLRSRKNLHQLAAITIVSKFPRLVSGGSDFPYVLFGIHSWQWETLPSINVPHIDVAFPSQGFFFSFFPDIGDISEDSWRSYVSTQSVPSASNPKQAKEFLESSHIPPAFTSRRVLEEVFRRRLRLSKDLIPVLPIFIDPRLIITIKDENQLAAYIDHCWQKAIRWGLQQLPPIPDNVVEEKISPTTWMSRRLFLEEAATTSLFN